IWYTLTNSLCLYIQVSWQSMEGPGLSPGQIMCPVKLFHHLLKRKERLANIASIWLTQFTPQVAVYGLYITASNFHLIVAMHARVIVNHLQVQTIYPNSYRLMVRLHFC